MSVLPVGKIGSVTTVLALVMMFSGLTAAQDGGFFDAVDSDGDGVADRNDNCPDTANPDQTDSDNDGVGDECDNCPETENPEQDDTDRDGVGDVCEEEDVSPDEVLTDTGFLCEGACTDICDREEFACEWISETEREITRVNVDPGVTISTAEMKDAIRNDNWAGPDSYCRNTDGTCVVSSECGNEPAETCYCVTSNRREYCTQFQPSEERETDGVAGRSDVDCEDCIVLGRERIGYGEEKDLRFECTEGSCDDTYDRLKICGERYSIDQTTNDYYQLNNVQFPDSMSCSLGLKEVDLLWTRPAREDVMGFGEIFFAPGKVSGSELRVTVDSVSGNEVDLKRMELTDERDGKVTVDETDLFDPSGPESFDARTGVALPKPLHTLIDPLY